MPMRRGSSLGVNSPQIRCAGDRVGLRLTSSGGVRAAVDVDGLSRDLACIGACQEERDTRNVLRRARSLGVGGCDELLAPMVIEDV